MSEHTAKRKKAPLKLSWYASGPLAGVACLLIFLLVSSLLMSSGTISGEYMRELLLASLFLSGLAAGASASGRRGGKRLLTGIITGAILTAFIATACLAAPGGGPFTTTGLAYAAAIIFGGALGGALRIKRVKRKIRARPRR